MMTDEFNPEEAAQAQSQPGTFSFVERLHGRGFPKSTVKVYLDEQAGFDRTMLAMKAEALKLDPSNRDAPKRALELEDEIAKLDERIAKSRYLFELHGFSPDRYDELINAAHKAFPPEIEETINPYSGEKQKREVISEDCDNYLHASLWVESIKKITDAEGNEDTTPLDLGTAARMRQTFPIDGRRKIDIRIQELRMGSGWMDAIQDEGFLATP